jgi:2,4-dienoyl-CoA reductase-like NADH-dependent reductase (Old Yellow Enzyme family)
VTFRNRIGVSPMCMYSATDGIPNAWHMVHLGSRAVGGAGMVMAEMTGVVPEARITPGCCGLWKDSQIEAWRPIANFIEAQGSVPAIQLAHAGRKSGYCIPFEGSGPLPEDQKWDRIAPSAVKFSETSPMPREMNAYDVGAMVRAFRDAAGRALAAGFRVVEIHGAHGYLVHQFLSPISNQRTDEYGGSFENRIRFCVEIADAIRTVWPERLPLLLRISATDWVDGGWTADETVELARILHNHGVDMVDCSSGGATPDAQIPAEPGFQVQFAERVRQEAGMPSAAVGLITEPAQAEAIIAEGRADMVLLAREYLRDPHWPLRAAKELGAEITPPRQYGRAW